MSYRRFVHFVNFERRFYDELSKQPKLDEPSMAYEDLMSISQALFPCAFLSTGGMMFDLFVLRFGIERHRKAMMDEKMDTKIGEEIVKRCTMLFVFECISKLPQVKRRSNTQLYLTTLAFIEDGNPIPCQLWSRHQSAYL